MKLLQGVTPSTMLAALPACPRVLVDSWKVGNMKSKAPWSRLPRSLPRRKMMTNMEEKNARLVMEKIRRKMKKNHALLDVMLWHSSLH